MRQKAVASVSVFQEFGTVVSVDGASLSVRTPSGCFDARRAASCLLAAQPGDRVLLAVPNEGDLYVLAVLDRDSGAPALVELGEDARISAGKRLTLSASEDVGIAGETVRVASQNLQISAAEGTFAVKKASLMSGALQVYADVVSAIVTRVESHLESLSVHTKHSQRYTEELDLTRAGTIDVRADQCVKIRGENTFVSADQLVKLDGEQIHLG